MDGIAPIVRDAAGGTSRRHRGPAAPGYNYRSSERKGLHSAEHYVVIRQEGGTVVGTSLPHRQDSKLRLELALEGAIASGRWWERTPVTSHFRGASYHGGDPVRGGPRGRRLRGRWLGFNSSYEIGDGRWDMNWVDSSTDGPVQRRYHYRA